MNDDSATARTTPAARSGDAPRPGLRPISLGEVPYEAAHEDMARWADERRRGEVGDRLFLLSHPPVITHSARTPADQLPGPGAGIPLVEVDRGGYATYHGPGQLIGYLIVGVRELGPVDLVRRVETALIDALGALGFPAVRRDTPQGASSLVGVWTPDHRKLASIGMRIRGGVSTHGFALNVDNDMSPFRTFTACALPGVEMVSLAELAAEGGVRPPGAAEVREAVARAFTEAFPGGPAAPSAAPFAS